MCSMGQWVIVATEFDIATGLMLHESGNMLTEHAQIVNSLTKWVGIFSNMLNFTYFPERTQKYALLLEG